MMLVSGGDVMTFSSVYRNDFLGYQSAALAVKTYKIYK